MKKNRIFLITIILFFLFSVIKVSAIFYKLPLIGKIIYVDPGHGGVDPGAVYKEIHEDNINLEISKILMEVLEKRGATVYLTRYNDNDLAFIGAKQRKKSDLSNRVKLINNSKADLYISVHLNMDNVSRWSGAQMFYNNINPHNKMLAQNIQQQFNNKKEVKKIDELYMYRNIIVPGVLAEVGFLSNSRERYLLQTKKYQKLISEKIVSGIINYFD